jgi:hypothetical protein
VSGDHGDPAEAIEERCFDLGVGAEFASELGGVGEAAGCSVRHRARDPDPAWQAAVDQRRDGGAQIDLAGAPVDERERFELALAERLGPVREHARELRDRDRGHAHEVQRVERDERAPRRRSEREPIRELAELGVVRDRGNLRGGGREGLWIATTAARGCGAPARAARAR